MARPGGLALRLHQVAVWTHVETAGNCIGGTKELGLLSIHMKIIDESEVSEKVKDSN